MSIRFFLDKAGQTVGIVLLPKTISFCRGSLIPFYKGREAEFFLIRFLFFMINVLKKSFSLNDKSLQKNAFFIFFFNMNEIYVQKTAENLKLRD